MEFFSRLSPLRAYRDLRVFLADRGPVEILFLLAAMAITLGLIWGFARDSAVAPIYRPDIIYVEQYRLDRTDAQITAQQKVDGTAKAKRMAERRRRDLERQASFKRLDEKLESYGF